jgi:hypothetical protein
MITLPMNRGTAVYLKQVLQDHQGTQDLRLTERTQAIGELLDTLNEQLAQDAS